MNTVVRFVTANRERFGLDRLGEPGALSYVVATPRFRASRNVVFLLLPQGGGDPVLVAKVPRLASDTRALDREAANLRTVHDTRAGGFAAVPRLIAYEEHQGARVLLESGLPGRPLTPTLLRRDPRGCTDIVVAWLLDLHAATTVRPLAPREWHERLVRLPLARLAAALPEDAGIQELVERTRKATALLAARPLPLVFEHGDLTVRNLLLASDGRLGVADWELASPLGLPAVDLFFFLASVAFALRRPRTVRDCCGAIDQVLIKRAAWGRRYLDLYAARLSLSRELLGPLLTACWARQVAELPVRLGLADGGRGRLGEATAAWLREHHFVAVWRHVLDRAQELQ